MSGASRRLAHYAAATPTSAFPAAVLDRARYHLLDYLGVCLAGAAAPSSEAMRAFVAGWAPGDATLIGRPDGAHPAYAALANGTSAHTVEMDDTHQAGSIHLGAPVISALIAASQCAPATGRAFLEAMVVGYEVAARLAMATGPAAHYARGFHPTATCGALGAAAAVSRLWGLDPDTTLHALGIGGSQASGLMEFLASGAWTKRFHGGWAAHNGLLAAGLARSGFRGPESVVEGRAGFVATFSTDPRPERVTDGLGATFAILETGLKPHACCRYMQAPIDALIGLATAHDVRPAEVERVTLGMLETAFSIVCEPAELKFAPRSVVDAQFSMPFGAAVALVHRRASIREFAPEVIASPTVRDLMGRVAFARDADLERGYPREWPAWAVVELRDGRKLSAHVRYPKGDPSNPLSWDEVMAKYRDLGSGVLSARALEDVLTRVRNLEHESDVAAVWKRLRVTGGNE